MKIVFLDSISVGEVSFKDIEKEGILKCYELTAPNETQDRIKDSNIIITNKVYIGEKEMEVAPDLKLICVAATGYNNVNLEASKRRNIVVANVKNYSTDSVAQITFSYILEFFSSLKKYDNAVKSGEWGKSKIFTMLNHPIIELKGKKLGIIGYGEIGKKVAEIGKAFGMEIVVAKRRGVASSDNFRVEFETVLKEADIITIHTPLTKESENMISENELGMMKKSAFLINCARGKIVDENALYKALLENQIAGAAVDVMEEEPPKNGSKLFSLNNIIITPHIAWAAKEARERLIFKIVENIQKFKAKDFSIDLTKGI